MDMSRSEEDAPALTIREAVMETRQDVKDLKTAVNLHLVSHAAEEGRREGRSSAWANLRAFQSTILPLPSAILAILALAAVLGGQSS